VLYSIFSVLNFCLNVVTTYKYQFACITTYTNSGVAYGQKIVKSLDAGPKHQIWYMHSSDQYKRFWRGYQNLKVKVKMGSFQHAAAYLVMF